jgi:hypothetical protein
MAVITQTQGVKTAAAAINPTVRALSASDTLTYAQGAGQVLELFNTTGSPVVVTLTGSAPDTSVPVSGYGSVSAAGGKAVTVPANAWTVVPLDAISHYLAGTGTVTVTGGTGVTAVLYV